MVARAAILDAKLTHPADLELPTADSLRIFLVTRSGLATASRLLDPYNTRFLLSSLCALGLAPSHHQVHRYREPGLVPSLSASCSPAYSLEHLEPDRTTGSAHSSCSTLSSLLLKVALSPHPRKTIRRIATPMTPPTSQSSATPPHILSGRARSRPTKDQSDNPLTGDQPKPMLEQNELPPYSRMKAVKQELEGPCSIPTPGRVEAARQVDAEERSQLVDDETPDDETVGDEVMPMEEHSFAAILVDVSSLTSPATDDGSTNSSNCYSPVVAEEGHNKETDFWAFIRNDPDIPWTTTSSCAPVTSNQSHPLPELHTPTNVSQCDSEDTCLTRVDLFEPTRTGKRRREDEYPDVIQGSSEESPGMLQPAKRSVVQSVELPTTFAASDVIRRSLSADVSDTPNGLMSPNAEAEYASVTTARALKTIRWQRAQIENLQKMTDLLPVIRDGIHALHEQLEGFDPAAGRDQWNSLVKRRNDLMQRARDIQRLYDTALKSFQKASDNLAGSRRALGTANERLSIMLAQAEAEAEAEAEENRNEAADFMAAGYLSLDGNMQQSMKTVLEVFRIDLQEQKERVKACSADYERTSRELEKARKLRTGLQKHLSRKQIDEEIGRLDLLLEQSEVREEWLACIRDVKEAVDHL